MAKADNNPLVEGFYGAFGKQIVFKKMNGKTVMAKYPDRSKVKYNESQKENQIVFAAAVQYARAVIRDENRIAAFKKKIHANRATRGASVYHAAIKAYMDKYSTKAVADSVEEALNKYLNVYSLTERQIKGIKHLITYKILTNSIYQRINSVSKATATRDLQDLQKQGVINKPAKGVGANYTLLPVNNEVDNTNNIYANNDEEDEIILI